MSDGKTARERFVEAMRDIVFQCRAARNGDPFEMPPTERFEAATRAFADAECRTDDAIIDGICDSLDQHQQHYAAIKKEVFGA